MSKFKGISFVYLGEVNPNPKPNLNMVSKPHPRGEGR
jgi:hypothetical protein